MGKNRLLQKRIMACVMAATMVVPSNVMASPYQTDEENPTAWEAAADDAEAVPEAEEAPVEDVVSEETVDAEAVEVQAADEENALSIANVVSIQATTKPNFYGQRLYQITIQFSQNTDMTDADKAESYGVWDRSYTDGSFEEGSANITDIMVDDHTVTLTFSQEPANNKPFGMLCTTSWNYAKKDGSDKYNTVITQAENKAAAAGEFASYAYGGYQTRDNLDLVVFIGGKGALNEETGRPEGGIALTDGFGNRVGGTAWEDTYNIDLDEFTLDYFDLAVNPDKYSEFDGKIPVYYYVPDSYEDYYKDSEEGITLVFYNTGLGTSYYEKTDADGNVVAANMGTNVTYDNCVSAWKKLAEDGDISNDVIIGSADVYSSKNPDAGQELGRILKWFTENYNIKNVVLEGNSNGTSICSEALRQYPDIVDAFIVNNGCIATANRTTFKNNDEGKEQYNWSDEDIQAIVDNGICFWVLNGEQDFMADPTYGLHSLEMMKELYKEAGYTDEWIKDNLRSSMYKDWQFSTWGVNHHSCIKVTSWNYLTTPYLDVYEDGVNLEVGATYKVDPGSNKFHLDLANMEFTTYGDSVSEWALTRGTEGPAAIDADSIKEISVDLSQAAQLPLTGYFTKSIGEDRSVKFYISENASVRSYFTVVSVPDGVDTTKFLEESGWLDLAEERGECLFILEPADGKWGTQAEEQAYVDAAMSFLKKPVNANNVNIFGSTFGEFYLAGLGGGAAALEAWAAAHPLEVIAQVYMNDEGVDNDYLDTVKDVVWDGDEGVYTSFKDTVTANLTEDEMITNKDIPIPTWLAGYGKDSEAYWLQENDCKAEAAADDVYGNVYAQKDDSRAWATLSAGPISKVAVSGEVKDVAASTSAVADFLYTYTRYENTVAYANSLAYRMDYSAARVEAQQNAADGSVKESLTGVDVIGTGSTKIDGHGTMTVGVISFADINGDGQNDPREYYMYVPEGYEGKKLPVVFIWAGGSQTNNIFFDATSWGQVADENGIVLLFPGENQTTNPVGVGYVQSKEFYDALMTVLAEKVDGNDASIDFTRIYSTGQSAGSGTTTGFMASNPEMFAAIASTSGIPAAATLQQGTYAMVPAYTIFGEGDIDHNTPWDDTIGDKVDSWVDYVLTANSLGELQPEDKTESTVAGDYDRFITHYWRNSQGIPLFQLGRTLYRQHNCYLSEMSLMWDYLEHFSYEVSESGKITRYYSESAFAEDDAVVIKDDANAPKSLDGVAAPCYDYTDANQLPMTGYFSKTLASGRQIQVYIPGEASCRPYFHVIAVPNDVDDVYTFLAENGWFDLADESGECLYILMPGEDGWNGGEEELAYVSEALTWLNTPKADLPDPDHAKNVNYWSAFGEWYFVGYGEGCAPLEAWAAKNPIFVISQVYVNGTGAGQSYLDATGDTVYPVGTNGYDITQDVKTRLEAMGESMIKNKDIPVPTWFVGYAADDYSVSYWKGVNGCESRGVNGVFSQAKDYTPWQTQYAGPISKVVVTSGEADGADIYGFNTYYTRYDNTSAYGNALMRRSDYSDVIVAAHRSEDLYAEQKVTMADGKTGTMICEVKEVSGELREFLYYIPDSAVQNKNGAPLITVWAGGSQTSIIFMDSTCWWETANANGVALAFAAEHYNTSVAVTPAECDACYKHMISTMKAWDEEGKFDIDFTRVYSTGQSMGSMESQQFAQETPEYYAAVASTSFFQAYPDTQSGKSIPTYFLNGEGNGKDDTGTAYDDRWNRTDEWHQYFLTVNGFEYQNPEYDANGNMTKLGVPISEPVKTVSGDYNRFETYTWYDENQVPLVQYTNSLYRPHNCLTTEIPMMWDYLEHFSSVVAEDGTVTRYYSASAFAEDDAIEILKSLQDEVTDIDYTIVKNFYGYKVGEVTVTFEEDVNADKLAAADFTLYDRGSANPYFGEVKTSDVKVDGNVVTLTIDQGTDKTADRSRNTFGAMTTTGWYMDTEGNIFFGSEDANDELGIAINPNLTGKSCFPRENLDLILCVNGTDIEDGIKSTDGHGNLQEDSVWDEITDESGLSDIKLEMVDPGWKAEGYTIVNEMEKTEGKVPVHVIYPEGYDKNRAEKYPVIFYQAGGGVCYWELTDLNQAGVYAPATNLGDNTVYDVMMTKWHEAVPEAIIMSVNVHSNLTESPREIAGVLDYAVKNWNVDQDKIVGVGNSMGTLITSELIRIRPDLVTAFVECNGNLGGMASAVKLDGTLANSSLGNWSEKEVQAFIENEVSVWMFNGETDGDNPAAQQDVIEIVKDLYREAGKSESWIDGHVRASGLQSWKFKQWGETDHSVTKVVAWNYIENAYTDVNAGQPALAVGDTYRFTGAEANYNKYQYTMDYDYTVYEESVSQWVRNLFAGTYDDPEEPVYTDVEAFVARLYENVLGRTPDAKGLAAWVSQLTSGANGGEEVAKGFIFSSEYTKKNTSNDAFVEMLYATLLNRKSDATGKKAWVAQLNSGVSREEIVEGFIHSNEFIGICGEYGIFTTAAEAFAARLYTECLGRSYDKKGLKAWADLLHSRKIGGGEAAKGFFFSDEFQNLKLDNKEFVTRCYRTFLNREPDAQGLANWMNVLAQSNDRASVLDGFIGSSEYAKLCVSYGIDK